MLLKLSLLLVILCGLPYAEMNTWKTRHLHRGGDPDTPFASCTVYNVSLSPCPRVPQEKECIFEEGTTNVTISFDFITDVDAEKMEYHNAILDIDNGTLDTNIDGCEKIQCPIKKGVAYSFSTTLDLQQNLFCRTQKKYTILWALVGKKFSVYNETVPNCRVRIQLEPVSKPGEPKKWPWYTGSGTGNTVKVVIEY